MGCLQEHHAQHPEAGSAAPGSPGEQLQAPRTLPEPTGFKRNTQLWGQGDAHTAPPGKWEPSTEKPNREIMRRAASDLCRGGNGSAARWQGI